MPITVTMPQLGESVVEGVIARWLKREGDAIARDEPFVEIMTDKVNVEVPAIAAGTLVRILAAEGATVPIGGPLAEIEPADAAAPLAARPTVETPSVPARPAAAERDDQNGQPLRTVQPVLAQPPSQRDAVVGGQRQHSPLVQRLAREHDLALDQVAGTGLHGRVTKQDVLAFLAAGDQPSRGAATAQVPPELGGLRGAAPTSSGDERVPLTPLRRSIAEHMLRSATMAPHATTVHEVDLTRLVRWRAEQRAAFQRRHGIEPSLLTFIVEATAGALREFPIMNSTWDGDAIVLKRELNVGVAVALDTGLIVPVIHRADELSRVGLARAVADLVERARTGQLRVGDVQGGTFTVNNVGVFGSIISTPIIHQPQAAILSAHAITKRVVVQPDDSLAVRSMMYLALSFDHRITDGMTACRFVESVCRRLEKAELPSPA